ncbi:VWA domain-containing protein [Actinocorallia longicatena]|uniref:VWA domain-containing protein n=2 Tax=Actinocorallia longicatena TaxID=111803 RepID=A0ABP6Q8C9_9ACTN
MGAGPDSRLVARAQDHLFGFLRALRTRGVGVPAGKQLDFLSGVELLAPSTTGRLYWIAVATLVTARSDLPAFDEVFHRYFGTAEDAVVTADEPPGETEDDRGEPGPAESGDEPGDLAAAQAGGPGLEASTSRLDAVRVFAPTGAPAHALLRLIRRELPAAVPGVRSRRHRRGGRGVRLDLRAICRASRRTQGEFVHLYWRHRPPRRRRVLLLIDVSGSMKRYSPDLLRFAHAVVASCDRAEVFTFGTRLTRVTSTLRDPGVDTALASLARLVLDADGGTLIGENLRAFLGDDRFVTMARGALVLVLSDGLERGDCAAMAGAVHRLARLSHRLDWWSPPACHPDYRPLTRGMSAILGDLDALTGVRDLETALAAVREGFAHAPTNREKSRVRVLG